MPLTLSSYSLEGIETVPVDIVGDGDGVMVIKPQIGSRLCLVKQRTTSSGSTQRDQPVNTRTFAPERSAPDRLRSENSTYYSYVDHIIQLTIDNQTQ